MIKTLYIIAISISAIYIGILITLLVCYSYTKRFVSYENTSVGVIYFIDSVALLVSTFVLIRSLNEDFNGTVLQTETRLLKILFGIFTIAYLGQTIFLLIAGAGYW